MNFKYCVFILCTAFIIALTSCLGDSDETEYIYSSDAELLSFQLQYDSISGFNNILYTIDQVKGEIYNVDSFYTNKAMPAKAILNYTTAGIYVCYVPEAKEDSAQIASGDSIDISLFTNQYKRYIRVYAANGAMKEYTLNLRIHKVDPDSIIYTKLPNPLPYSDYSNAKTILLNQTFYSFAEVSGSFVAYSSMDAQSWSPLALSGFPADARVETLNQYKNALYVLSSSGKLYQSFSGALWTEIPLGDGISSVQSIMGEIKQIPSLPNKVKPVMALVGMSEGNTVYLETDMAGYWKKGGIVESKFPVSNLSSASWVKDYSSNLVVLGDTIVSQNPMNVIGWANGDGISWTSIIPMFERGEGYFVVPSFSNVFCYDSGLYLINGTISKDYYNIVYYSVDGANTWKKMPDKCIPPAEYVARKRSSVCVDANNYIYIFGGEGDNVVLTDIWKARLNRLGF